MIQVDIRWSDLDANRHLANSSFLNFMSHARLKFMKKYHLDQRDMVRHNLGPVLFYEHVYYFKEVLPDDRIFVDVELKGMSKNGSFFQFEHNIYDQNGGNKARCNLMGAWIDLKKRKITGLPEEFLHHFHKMEKSEDFKMLTREDTRKHVVHPENIDPDAIRKKLYEGYTF